MSTLERELSGLTAIVGLGITDVGKVYGRTVSDFAVDAVQKALSDCGLTPSDVDGIVTSYGMSGSFADVSASLGMRDLRLNVNMSAAGATASAAIQYAASAVAAGTASCVVYVHADAPLVDPAARSSASYTSGAPGQAPATGMRSVREAVGQTGPNALYAMAARRHIDRYGTTSEQLGAVAVSQREWAAGNPIARFRDPITIEDHQQSRIVCDPLHLLDCCMVSNGGIAFIVTSAERAKDLPQPPVYVLGWGQGHPVYSMTADCELGLRTGAVQSGATAMRMAGVSIDDVDQAQIYDCYTFTVAITLEDYGFCAKGEGGPFAASGALGPMGSLPTNTGGGQLSGYYLWGTTPLSEAVIQGRGQGGSRQAARNNVIMVSGNGGILDYHGTLILSPHRKP
jgi:acetyl-CoA acetyltransferase